MMYFHLGHLLYLTSGPFWRETKVQGHAIVLFDNIKKVEAALGAKRSRPPRLSRSNRVRKQIYSFQMGSLHYVAIRAAIGHEKKDNLRYLSVGGKMVFQTRFGGWLVQSEKRA
jgi:hypothetical protein